ncbi:RHS repeat domain-containing protein [Limisphaera sp. VF-2]|uniref:RHS repeat domain-containing protein n=1 Tax=Limisphaera sp. VF-2 TaxID=3400418 RepID=UPI003C280200
MYSWGAENRLGWVMSHRASDRASWRRVDWAYDALGRRTRQTSYVLSNGVWVVTEDLKFVSDPVWFGRHVVELNATNQTLVSSYVWGLDLSETLDSASGVGGLLWVRVTSGPASGTHFVTYDGNGNVWQLVSSSTGTETGRYEYGPFGDALRTTGPAAASSPFRFSTKRTDPATGLVLYEYRLYSPALGKWLSRDPVVEAGFESAGRWPGRARQAENNLYGFLCCDPLGAFDLLGLYEYEWKDSFSEAEKQGIQNSIARVRDRAKALIQQMDDNISKLSKLCRCAAYAKLIKNLEHLKRILEGMVREIEDPGWNLEIYRGDLGDVYAKYWNSPVPWYDDELTLDNGWFKQSANDRDSTMFHEISHGQGTDDETSNPYNDAYLLEVLMHVDKEDWIVFKRDKQNADRQCKPAGR